MIKYYCDRCGKEAKSLNSVKIPVEKQKGYTNTYYSKPLDLCKECENEANEIFDTITDIEISLFSKYLKKGGEVQNERP